jgi:ribosome-associated protein
MMKPTTDEFELRGSEFIELVKLLKILGWVETGGEAKIRITGGEVLLNGEVEWQKRKKIRTGDKVQMAGHIAAVK